MIVFSSFIIIFAALVVPDANPSLFLYDKFFTNEKKLTRTFKDKRIWITGASSGIGAELARQLHSHGAKVIISGRREGQLKSIQELCEGTNANIGNNPVDQGDNECDSKLGTSSSNISTNGSNISVLPFDVTDTDENISDVVATAIERFDGIDILILNAGAGQLSPAVDDSFSTTRALMEVNFMGPVRIAMELIQQGKWGKYSDNEESNYLTKKRGHIVVTSSVASRMALPLGTSYSASKHAVHGYFQSLRSECAEWLRIDLPCPGPIATEFQDNVLNGMPSSISMDGENSEKKNGIDDSDSDGDESEIKMPVQRCAKLILSGMMGPAGMMQETWISRQPTLSFMFINQYLPNLSNTILGKIGPLRLKAFRAGLPLYKVSSWVKAAEMEKEQRTSRQRNTK